MLLKIGSFHPSRGQFFQKICEKNLWKSANRNLKSEFCKNLRQSNSCSMDISKIKPSIGTTPPVTGTTRIITFLVGNPGIPITTSICHCYWDGYKPSIQHLQTFPKSSPEAQLLHELGLQVPQSSHRSPSQEDGGNLRCLLQNGSVLVAIDVISRVITPLIGVITLVTHL